MCASLVPAVPRICRRARGIRVRVACDFGSTSTGRLQTHFVCPVRATVRHMQTRMRAWAGVCVRVPRPPDPASGRVQLRVRVAAAAAAGWVHEQRCASYRVVRVTA